MIRTALLLLLAAACVPAQDGWISLFNGKDFTGWKVNENQQTFTIKDGAIVSHGPRSHCFYVGDVHNHDFKDFELMVDVMTLPGSNGGVYFHTAYQDVSWPEKGFEVQVNEYQRRPHQERQPVSRQGYRRRRYQRHRAGQRVVHRAHRGEGR